MIPVDPFGTETNLDSTTGYGRSALPTSITASELFNRPYTIPWLKTPLSTVAAGVIVPAGKKQRRASPPQLPKTAMGAEASVAVLPA